MPVPISDPTRRRKFFTEVKFWGKILKNLFSLVFLKFSEKILQGNSTRHEVNLTWSVSLPAPSGRDSSQAAMEIIMQ
jgi:hypothetical protein